MILVTGGTGLVGSHLLYQLALKQNGIRAIYRHESKLKKVKQVFAYYTDKSDDLFQKIEWVKASLEDIPSLEMAFKNVKIVYHCAALVSFNEADYRQMRNTNIHGTANMVNLSIDNKVSKFCYVSSIAAVDGVVGQLKVNENGDWNSAKKSGYAITKYGAEQEVWRGSQEGLKVVIVNPGVIIGPGFWQSGTGQLFEKIYKGLKFYANGITGYIGVNDVAKAMIALTDSDLNLERYLLVSENLSFKQIFNLIADSLQVKKPNIKLTKWVAALAWRFGYLKSILTNKPQVFTKKSAESLFVTTYYDNSKIKQALGYEFETMESVIKKTASFFLNDKLTV